MMALDEVADALVVLAQFLLAAAAGTLVVVVLPAAYLWGVARLVGWLETHWRRVR